MPELRKNGPDLIDVEMMMRAIEAMHGGAVSLTVSPAGIGSNGGLVTVLQFEYPSLTAGGLEEIAAIVNRWPCPMHRDFWACVFEGLYRLDLAIGRSYQQETLPEA